MVTPWWHDKFIVLDDQRQGKADGSAQTLTKRDTRAGKGAEGAEGAAGAARARGGGGSKSMGISVSA